METSILLAKFMGPIMLFMGMGLLVSTGFYKTMIKNFKTENIGMLLFSLIGAIIGMYIVLNHNIFELNYRGIITVLGWAILIKSSFFLAVPKLMISMTSKIKYSKFLLKMAGIIYIIVGLCLMNNGFSII